jgi:hypothetical protein
VVDVPDGPDVDVRLRPVELLLRHVSLSLLKLGNDECGVMNDKLKAACLF